MSQGRSLTVLKDETRALELCVFCPKLCRAACPVSTAEGRETVTPWGKMSGSYFVAKGNLPFDAEHAAPAWACTTCFACRERCDHGNEVGPVLLRARGAFYEKGVAPPGAVRTARTFPKHEERVRRAASRLGAAHTGGALHSRSGEGLLVGCSYLVHAPAEASDACNAASALAGAPLRLAEGCCGLPLLHAGDEKGFAARARQFVQRLDGVARLLVVDPGCALALLRHYPDAGVSVPAKVELLVDLAARSLSSLRPLPRRAGDAAVRYHDPCQLGRGLGRYDEPRAVLARLLGEPPGEFPSCRQMGACSGAGGLLPLTSPKTSRAITRSRLDEHASAGGGQVVTHCGASLSRFRAAGAKNVSDLVSFIARGVGS